MSSSYQIRGWRIFMPVSTFNIMQLNATATLFRDFCNNLTRNSSSFLTPCVCCLCRSQRSSTQTAFLQVKSKSGHLSVICLLARGLASVLACGWHFWRSRWRWSKSYKNSSLREEWLLLILQICMPNLYYGHVSKSE